MPSPAYFAQFGLFAVPQLLTSDACARIRAAMDVARAGRGTVWNPLHGERMVSTKQRTEFNGLPDDVCHTVCAALNGVRSELSSHFGQELNELQPPMFARYDKGDFYGVHNDVSHHPDAPDAIRQRKVSVVVFLNDQSDDPEPGSYCGGRLTFHGLVDEPPWNNAGHPLDAEAGLLIGFPPALLHEVTPVTSGSRYTLVSWFC